MNMASRILPSKEFINQLIAKLSGGDKLVDMAIGEYEKGVAKFGDDEKFAHCDPKQYCYLESVMHKAKDLNTRVMGIEYFAESDRVPKYEYLSHAIDTFGEAHLRFSQMFRSFDEQAAIQPTLRAEHLNMLSALEACVDFSKQQYLLAAPDKQAGRG